MLRQSLKSTSGKPALARASAALFKRFNGAEAGKNSPNPAASFLNGTNSVYVDEMYHCWLQDPTSVHASWDVYFRTDTYQPNVLVQPGVGAVRHSASASNDVANMINLVHSYHARGHEKADLDPLGLRREAVFLDTAEDRADAMDTLDYRHSGFTEQDLGREMDFGGVDTPLLKGLLNNGDLNGDGKVSLQEAIDYLDRAYCGKIAYEFQHCRDQERIEWLQEKIEDLPLKTPSKEKSKQTLERLDYATTFEYGLAKKFTTAKRFGMEGLESTIPGLKALIDRSMEQGAEDFVFGMAHRGRLNVLANVLRKPMEVIFKEFKGSIEPTGADSNEDWSMSGDVKYHLGSSHDRTYPNGKRIHLSLMANPSHLEAVNPMVSGKARAKMHFKGDESGETIVPVLLHGDAAFSGQGIVYESMQFARTEHYATGGTIHVVTNNQVGFTADPWQSRSTLYSSDIGKAFEAPIFHVNADAVDEVVAAFEMASEYRQKFKTDVIVDIIGYRKRGHNEIDEPRFTQPLMYQTIDKHPTSVEIYRQKLVAEGRITQEEANESKEFVEKSFEDAFVAAGDYSVDDSKQWYDSPWEGIKQPTEHSTVRKTGVDVGVLEEISSALVTIPDDFNIHRRLGNIIKAKATTLEEKANLDWGTAEALAFGSLLVEGTHVRISGQDVQRGTFSHRHGVWHDQKTNENYTPLNNIRDGQAKFVCANSPLSEFGVMGFELGYAQESPLSLVIWEAQFGDFVNGAQIMIDQFLSSGEAKWGRQNGLVLLLPHGHQGQGPEHSSCRVERFLQCVDEDPDIVPEMDEMKTQQIQVHNWQIVNCTTPANYFHVLRRQQHRDFRKPLIVVAPKGLLRHKLCTSTFDEMAEGTQFKRVFQERFPDEIVEPEKVRRVVFCSGQVYFELLEARRKGEIDDVALVTIEQLSPFPFDLVAETMKSYTNAEVVWAQEEPKNMGAWSFVQDRIMTASRVINGERRTPGYVGRKTMASPAEGYGSVHDREQKAIVDLALSDDVTTWGWGRTRPHLSRVLSDM
jgi:2-oxoglutarate dehydrogenase E1 component